MAAVLDLITEALVTVKALEVGEDAGPDMTTDALNRFNEVLEALSIQNLAVYASADAVVPLQAGVAVYTLGPGGTGQRPLSLNAIDSVWLTYDGVDFPVNVVGQGMYDAIAIKQTTGIPTWAAYDNGYPNATLSLYPVPDKTCILHFSQRQQFTAATAVTDNFNMPPGYRRLIRLMLAWELRTDYPGLSPQELQNLKDDVTGALGAVKRANLEEVLMVSDAAGMFSGGYGDWRLGT